MNEKSNIDLSVPTTLADFQNLLNNESVFNKNDPALGALTGEDYYVTNSTWLSATTNPRNAYVFASDIYQTSGNYSDWSAPYNAIYIANIVLEGLNQLKNAGTSPMDVNQLIGQALFYRSWQFYNLIQNFSMPYDSATAKSDLGVPLRLTSDFNIKIGRSSVKDCYDQIINDFKNCLTLLPATSDYKTRPSEIATYAALARVYLSIGNYSMALKYADSTLNKYNALLNFNTLSTTSFPISKSFVSEDIFHNILNNYSFIFYGNSSIDSTLISSYDNNDLRKVIYFTKRPSGVTTFKGTYDYKDYSYSGLATDEMYLIRAECSARSGEIAAAMSDLNSLLVTRWKTGTFIPFTASTTEDALNIILTERRKELIFRGLRWTDLRRLNKEPRFMTTLIRNINGISYSLPPNDPRYAMPIPVTEIQLNGIEQNNR